MMKNRLYWKMIIFLLAAIMMASCSHTPSATLAASPQPSGSAASAPALSSAAPATASPVPATAVTSAPAPTPSPSPVPLPTVLTVPDLPNPGRWKASLHISADDYPRVDGSTATLPLAIYMRSKITGVTLADSTAHTRFSTTGPAWQALADKYADLLVVYEAPDEIKQYLQDNNADLTVKPIGIDALVFLTNKGNGVGSLTQQQIVDIYTGKIKNWSEVGGADSAIIPYQRVSNSGSQALMLKLVMKGTKIMYAPEMLQPGEMEGLVNDIASYDNTNNALGYSVYYYVRNMYTLPGIQLLAVDGVAPTSDTIASGAYPYVNPFYAAIRADEPADSPAHKLFDWLTGAEGKRAIKDAGYVPAK